MLALITLDLKNNKKNDNIFIKLIIMLYKLLLRICNYN